MRRLPKMTIGTILISLTWLLALFPLASCASQPQKLTGDLKAAESGRNSRLSTDDEAIEKLLMSEYDRWKGVRHELGGNGSDGVDCSGFVKAVFRNVFKINLPRTTGRQVRIGSAVDFSSLRAGDLVFFRPHTYPRHVGIYLSGNKFMHASKEKGVIISSLEQPYWSGCVWTARRILKY